MTLRGKLLQNLSRSLGIAFTRMPGGQGHTLARRLFFAGSRQDRLCTATTLVKAEYFEASGMQHQCRRSKWQQERGLCQGRDAMAMEGDLVKVHYKARLENGELVEDTYKDDEPQEFVIGGGDVLEGIDAGVRGMRAGESKELFMEPEQGLGTFDFEKLITVDLSKKTLTADAYDKICEGNTLQFDGENFKIVQVEEENGVKSVTIDTNHEHAGMSLIVKLKLVSISTQTRGK